MTGIEFYSQIEKLYGELSLFDAIGLVGHQIREKIEAALQEGADCKTLAVETASLLKLENAASKMLDEEKLEPEQRIMFSVIFSKDLKDVKHFLLQSQNRDEIPQEEKEKAELYLMQLSMILKDVLTDKYLPKPVAVDICDKDKPYMKDLVVRSLMYVMRKLADGLNLDETLEHTLILFESDLERFGYVLRKNDSYKLTEKDLQEALNEEFPTDPQTLQCHSETIQGLIVNLIMGAGLNQFDINKQTRMFLISALMYGRAALMAAPDLSHEIEREIEALRDFCKRYYDPE